jgi:hypothetical protein
MYIINYLTETEKGVFERKKLVEGANCIYELTSELRFLVSDILRADNGHYNNMFPVVENLMPGLIGKYKNVTAIGGGFPKFENTILKADHVTVIDMNTDLYIGMEDMFREAFKTSIEMKYQNKILDEPFALESDCVTFVHFLEHMPNFETVKNWINCQKIDIVIYMPCIEAAQNENWWHYNDQHNVFFTVDAIKEVGEKAGYKCEALRYSDDMLIWMKR